MNVLFYGTILILIAFFLHLFIWRIRLPRNHTGALLLIFFGTLIAGIFIFSKCRTYAGFFDIPVPGTIYEYMRLALFFVALTLAYTTTYSPVEVDSPSLVIIREIAESGPRGLDRAALDQRLGDDILVMPRLRDLVAGGMVRLDGEIYKLTPKGIFLARIFTTYRILLNKREKGG